MAINFAMVTQVVGNVCHNKWRGYETVPGQQAAFWDCGCQVVTFDRAMHMAELDERRHVQI